MYYFYLDKILLPIPPPKLQLKISNKNKTLTLIDTGEVNLLKTPGLTEISFETEIPHTKYPYCTYANDFIPIDTFLAVFEKLKNDKKPFIFTVSRFLPNGDMTFDTNMRVSMEDYTIAEDVKEGFDVKVNIKLKEYRNYLSETLEVDTDDNGNATASLNKERETKEKPKTYTVKKGDNLWSICKKYLGNGGKCYEIAKLNNISNPSLIYPGQVIKFE